MDSVKSLYPQVKEILQKSIPDTLPALKQVLEKFFAESILPEAMLPLASCKAVGGNPKDAIYISAALIAMEAGLRILDDLQDQDRTWQLWQEVGIKRAWNYSSASHLLGLQILSQAPFAPDLFHRIHQYFLNAFFQIAAGQDRDLAGNTKTIEDYWLSIEMKTGSGFATACAAGAMVGTDDPELIQACGVFGHHLGLAIQIFNDMESIWLPEGVTDFKQGKVTLPLLYGLQTNHPEREELLSLVKNNEIASHAERIKEILDNIDTKGFLIWAALKEREQALEAIKICPNAEGKEVLESYITGMFGDIDLLLQNGDKSF